MQTNNSQIKLSLRGAGGLLGHRLFRTIVTTQSDMKICSVILGKDEESFRRFQSTYQALEKDTDLSEIKIYIDASRKEIEKLMTDWQSPWHLYSLDQGFGDLQDMDTIIDSAIVIGNDNLRNFYSSYAKKKPIIHQSGTGLSETIQLAPPFEPKNTINIKNFRQGDCLISGVAPIIFTMRNSIEKLDITLLVQRQGRLNDYTLRDNLDDIIMNPNLEHRIHGEISALIPNTDPKDINATVFEVPGHDYYACIFKLKLLEPTTREAILETLKNQPRINVAPAYIPISTGQIQQKLREPHIENFKKLEPIICFSSPGGVEVNGCSVVIRATFYSKAITMMPNIDSVRGLVNNVPMIEAMKQTDIFFGYQKKP